MVEKIDIKKLKWFYQYKAWFTHLRIFDVTISPKIQKCKNSNNWEVIVKHGKYYDCYVYNSLEEAQESVQEKLEKFIRSQLYTKIKK
jgi:hypothetical protein